MNWVHEQWYDPETMIRLQGQYDVQLVLLSVFIACAAAFISFYLIEMFHRQKGFTHSLKHMVMAGASLGGGIWSTHFIGMLAFQLPVSISYDKGITALSVLPAFLASTAAVYFLIRKPSQPRWIVICGGLMAVAIAIMHYTGMAAMQVAGRMAYDPLMFTVSILAGLFLSPIALGLRPFFGRFIAWQWAVVASAISFGLVVATVHYTAMAATLFSARITTLYDSSPAPADPVLIGAVSASAVSILLASVLVGAFDRKLFATRQALGKTVSRMEAVVDSIGEAIFVISRDGVILSANAAARHIFFTDEKNSFSNLSSLMTDADGQAILSAVKTMRPSGPSGSSKIMGEATGLRTDGREFPMDIAISCLSNEDDRLVAVCGDSTDRKLAAEKAEAQRDKLEVLLAERTETLENTVRQLESEVDIRRKAERMANAAREEAEMANRSKSEFLANVSHELRTPLNAIIGFSEVLMDERLSRLADQQNYLQDIHSSGRHLLSIINDILDLAKVEAGCLTLEETSFPLEQVTEAAICITKERIQDAGLTLETHVPGETLILRADERKLKQLLLNLLSNSIKFTGPGGTIVIETGIADDGFVLSVRDTGIGMSKADLEKVMNPFVQVDSSISRAHEGTGLGLSIARSFAELHGGRLMIESKEGEGTCVTLKLPGERVFFEENCIMGKGHAAQ